jgi:A/G-specific adenine glycosylase
MAKASSKADKGKAAGKRGERVSEEARVLGFSAAEFRRKLSRWYREYARELPWRGVDDPYATWLSEIMLQQTRVATVLDRYREFLERFPTIGALAAAEESDVLALWSGLGYYRRARMLHRGAQFVEREMEGKLPRTATALRTLPGVGEYTAAAIASIAFGESVAVLDGNVERVLLRVLGEPEDKSARMRTRLVEVAQMLMPGAKAKGAEEEQGNPAGDHNQAMMELGATVCLPRGPLCLECPAFDFCRTRGEHSTATRTKMQSRDVAHQLALRKRGVVTEVLLVRRGREESLMAGMMELPVLTKAATEGREPALRVRHSITMTNYYVQVFTENAMSDSGRTEAGGVGTLLDGFSMAKPGFEWVAATRLAQLPLTGLTRKILQRLNVMDIPRVKIDRES